MKRVVAVIVATAAALAVAGSAASVPSAASFDRKPSRVAGLVADGWGTSTTAAELKLKGRFPNVRIAYAWGAINNATATSSGFSVVPTGDTAPITVTSAPVNQPPSVSAGGPYAGTEGGTPAISGSASDPEGDTLTALWTATPGAGTDPGASCSWVGQDSIATANVICNDDGVYTLTLTVNDGHNPPVSASTTLTLANTNPSVTITSPPDTSTVTPGTPFDVSASISDQGANDTHTCSISWGDGTTSLGVVASGVCTGSHTYGASGAYTITVTATDDDGGSGSDSIMVVIFDQETKVSGGGFVVDNGRTSFGFVAKSETTGGLVGQIQIWTPGNDRFHGDTVSSLTSNQNTASWSGSGRWNGVRGYTFQVSVVDNGQGGRRNRTPDTVSITIKNADGATVFNTSGELKGGNITVHR